MDAQAKIGTRETYPGSHLEKAHPHTLWLRIVRVVRITRIAQTEKPAKDPVLSVQECL